MVVSEVVVRGLLDDAEVPQVGVDVGREGGDHVRHEHVVVVVVQVE